MDDPTTGQHGRQQVGAASQDAESRSLQRRARGSRQLVKRHYLSLVELAPDAIVVSDATGRIVLVNRQTELLYGYPRDDLLGQPVEWLLPEPLHTVHRQHRANYAAAPRPRPMGTSSQPLYGRRQDGTEFPVEVTLATFMEAGETYVIASIRDVIEVQRVQSARLAAEAATEDLRRLQALTDIALAHLELDDLLPMLLHRVREVMQADHVTILLLEPDGQTLAVRAELHQADDAPAWQHVPVGVGFAGRIAASRAPLIVDDLSTFPLVRPQRHQSLRSAAGVPLLAEEQLLGVLCIGAAQVRHFGHRDVVLLEQAADRISTAIVHARLFAAQQTARQEAERERIQWRTAMDSAPEFVITCDGQLRRTYVNPAYERLRGGGADPSVPVEELSRRYGLFLPDGKTLFPVEQLPLTRAVREGRPVRDVEMMLRAPDGQERLVVWESAPMYSAGGELLGAISIGHDITERRQLEREREAARTEAEQQAEQLNRIIEAMADGVTVWDATGQLVRTNAALRRMMALDAAPPDYLKRPPKERIALYEPRDAQGHLLPPEDWPVTRALRGEVVTGSDAVEVHMLNVAGHDLVFTASTAPLRDQDGHIVGAVGILRDQTERKQLERQLAEQAEQLDRVFEAMADALIVYDAHGRTIRTNAAAQQLLGLHAVPPGYYELRAGERVGLYRKRDALGRPLAPHDSPSSRALRGEVLTGSNALDIRLRTLDGREVEVNSSAAPLRDQEGHIVGAVGIMRDQTERRRLERAVAEQAEQLDRIVEATGEGLLVYDARGRVVRTNAAARRLLGWDAAPPEYLDLPLDERIARYAPRDAQGQLLTSQAWQALRAKRDANVPREPEAFDLRLWSLDGRELEVSANFALLRAPDGRVVGGVLLLSDRTERNRLEREREQARASEQAQREMAERLDQFFTIAAHDIRTPVTALGGFIELAQMRIRKLAANIVAGDGQQGDQAASVLTALEKADQSSERLQRLVTRLFDIAQANAGRLTLSLAPCDLGALVRDEVAAIQAAEPARIIQVKPLDESAMVEADADRVGQVLTNYLTNALKYSPTNQPIEVRIEMRDEQAKVLVQDHGAGLPQAELSRVWELLHRAPGVQVQSGTAGSLGMGLYIAKRIMELHPGGQVGVDSVVGEGSTFWLSLPLVPTQG